VAERRPSLLLLAALLLATLLSLFSIYKRHQVETENRALVLATEIDTVESLGASAGMAPDKALTHLKASGLNGVVLGEQSVGELAGQGQLRISVVGNETLIDQIDPTVAGRVRRGLELRGFHLSDSSGGILVPASPTFVRGTTIGLDPRQTATAQKAGVQIIARAGNPAGSSGSYVRGTLEWMHELGASMFLPSGDQVLGRRESIDTTVETLAKTGMRYVTPEFAKIGGDEDMVAKAPDNVIRLHSAQSTDLDKLTPIDAIDRYEKAARERENRILLLRPVSNASENPLSSFGQFVESVAKATAEDGLQLGTPHPYREPGLPRFFSLLIGLAAAPIVWFAAAAFVENRKVRTVGAVLLGLLALACVTKTGTQLMALLAASSAPVVAFRLLDELATRFKGLEWLHILQAFVLVSAVSLVGGLIVAGMLNGLPYYVKAEEFKGIKIAVFLPVLGIGWYAFMRLTDWRGNLRSPITWGAVLLSMFLAAAMAFMLARTGNDSGVGASGPEMALRNLLDRIAYVRPRTKEFLVGHPILVVALGLFLRYRNTKDGSPLSEARVEEGTVGQGVSSPADAAQTARGGWIALLLLLGAVGQTSVVNTLCHLHIPVTLSLARIGIGLALGCILGFVLWAVVGRLDGQRR
jgi:hypothetical protein